MVSFDDRDPLEREILHAIRLALGKDPRVVLWRNQCGTFRDGERAFPFGLIKGSSDLIGIVRPTGRFVALEVKSPTGRATREQKLFLDLVAAAGGVSAIVRSVEAARAVIDAACKVGPASNPTKPQATSPARLICPFDPGTRKVAT